MIEIFSEFAAILIFSAIAGGVAMWLKQPVLIAYIVVGIILGPAVSGLVAAHDQIDLLAQIGITVLMFLVGLKLDLHHVRNIGPVALATGLGQLTFTILIGFLIVYSLGRSVMEALYVAIALTFSSTIIIIKLLTDKGEIDSLHGRIAVGFLIVQDLAVVLLMMVMSTVNSADQGDMAGTIVSLVLRIVLVVALMYLLMRYVLSPVVNFMARAQETLLIFAVAWGTSLAALGSWAGFSKEAGAFLAGFSLASTTFRDAIGARLTAIRDFLLLFFFIDLGAKINFSVLNEEAGVAALLSLFVLIGNPLIVMAIMGYMGYRKRTGFNAGLTVAQISEFSIIFIAMGVSLGHIRQDVLGLVTLIGIVTIALSSYMILYSHQLYQWLGPWLNVFERKRPFRELAVERQINAVVQPDVIVLGLGRYGKQLALGLRESGVNVLGVDFDPETVRTLRNHRISVRYGDAQDINFLSTLPISTSSWIVSTLPGAVANRELQDALKSLPLTGKLAVLARVEHESHLYAKMGFDTVLAPMHDAVEYAVTTLTQIMKKADEPSE